MAISARSRAFPLLFAAALSAAGCAGSVSTLNRNPVASDVAFTFPVGKGGSLITPSFAAVEGNQFQITGSSIVVVTDLGYESQQSSQIPEPTAIFDASGNVLASATISSADLLSDGYYWKPISPITLTAGSTYYIGSLHGSGTASQYTWNTHTATVPNYLTDLGTYFKVASTIDGGSWQYGGGTSQYGSGEIRHYVGNFKARIGP